jgi:hypothetical protein
MLPVRSLEVVARVRARWTRQATPTHAGRPRLAALGRKAQKCVGPGSYAIRRTAAPRAYAVALLALVGPARPTAEAGLVFRSMAAAGPKRAPPMLPEMPFPAGRLRPGAHARQTPRCALPATFATQPSELAIRATRARRATLAYAPRAAGFATRLAAAACAWRSTRPHPARCVPPRNRTWVTHAWAQSRAATRAYAASSQWSAPRSNPTGPLGRRRSARAAARPQSPRWGALAWQEASAATSRRAAATIPSSVTATERSR